MTTKIMPRIIRPLSQKKLLANDWLTWTLIALFVVLSIMTIVVAFNVVRGLFSSKSQTGLNGSSHPQANLPAGGFSPTSTVTLSTGPLQSAAGPTPQPWDGKSRINILLLGLDYRDWQAYDVPRSDSMILLTVDPATATAGMLSIPRDMWVTIPDHYEAKINTAYFLGEVEKLPGGGPGLAMKTVEQFMGVPVNYYAQVDFQAFTDFVDKIGGITVDVPEDITVDPLGPGNTMHLKAGVQHMFGPEALGYARNRETELGDFDRANRQQQVIIAIRDRVLKANVWPTLIANAPGLYQDLASGIHSNLTLDQVLKLAFIARQIPVQNIKKGVIGPDMTTNYTTSDGQEVLMPNTELILQLRDQVFSSSGAVPVVAQDTQPTATLAPTPSGSIQTEKATISVQNGTGTSGLASRTSDFFKSLGLNVVEQANADPTEMTNIFVYSDKPLTTALLAKTMNIPTSRIYYRSDANPKVDIVVVLGNDWDNNNPMTNP